jgi:hypothetical protein
MVAMFENEAFRKLRHLGQSLTALSGANLTNWLITNHADAYLYGSLAAVEPFLNDPRVGMWKGRRDEILESILRDALTVTAITSYTTLKTALYTNWLGRPDEGIAAGAIPDMIALFEGEATRRLRHHPSGTITALSAGNATNWLLTANPDAYLFGSLAAAEPFMPADPRIGMWKTRRDEILGTLAAGHRGLP